MTTPNGAIVFHATSGSDTQASGLGPTTAEYGSGATTDGTAVVTGITTTGVTAGDLLWVQTASGRQFSIVASVDSGTQVTCDNTFVLGTGQTWAIGGKRATWDDADSRQLFADALDLGWTIETETDQSLTSAIDMSGTGVVTIRGAGSTLRTITQTVDAEIFTQGDSNGLRGTTFQYLKAENSYGGTKTFRSTFVFHNQGGNSNEPVTFENCEIGDATNQLYYGVQRQSSSAYFNFFDCYIHDCIISGVLNGASSNSMYFIRCRVIGNGSHGVNSGGTSAPYVVAVESLFAGNGGSGFRYEQDRDAAFTRCAFYGNSTSGLYLPSGSSAKIVQCVFVENGTYGIENAGAFDAKAYRGNNIFYGNTSGSIATGSVDSSSYEATTDDPFTDSANYDFSLNSGTDGTALKSTTSTLFDGATTSRPFRWLDNSAGGGGASGSSRLVNGGLVD